MRKLRTLVLTCFALALPMVAEASDRTDIFKNATKIMINNQDVITMVLLKKSGDYQVKSIHLYDLSVDRKMVVKVDAPSGELPWVKAVGWEDFPDGININYESIVIHIRSLDDLTSR